MAVNIDTLGENPQVFGWFYYVPSFHIPPGVPTKVLFESVSENIDCSLYDGIITVNKPGIYFIETCVTYTPTMDGYETYIILKINGYIYRYSNVECDSEVGTISYVRRTISSVTSLADLTTDFIVEIYTNNPGGTDITGIGGNPYNTYFRIARLR